MILQYVVKTIKLENTNFVPGSSMRLWVWLANMNRKMKNKWAILLAFVFLDHVHKS